MRAIQARVLTAALLVLGGCTADSGGNGLSSVVGSPITGSGGATGTGGLGGVPHGTGGTSSFGNSGGTGGHPVVTPTPMNGMAGMGSVPIKPVGTGGGPAPIGTGGGPAPTGGTGGTVGGMMAPAGSTDPIVPMVSGDCPAFTTGTISFMGLGGIDLEAGGMPEGATAPMVFYWHGTGSFAGEYVGSAADVFQGVISEGGVLISFQDTTGGDLLSGTAIFGATDFDLTDQLLACAVRDHNIDSRKVYATGCSAGGLFSDAMAAERSNYMAAVASNSGGWTVPVAFQNDHTPSLMTIHGAAGVDVVGIDFSQSSATADDAFKARGAFVVNCDHGGGHCGGGGLAPEIWQFFQAHTFGVDPEPWASGLPAGFSTQCVIK